MKYLSISNKNLIINKEIFDITDKVKIMHDKDEIIILTKDDNNYVPMNYPKGYLLKLFVLINDNWLYYEKIFFNYEIINISSENIEKYLLDRKKFIKEFLSYGD